MPASKPLGIHRRRATSEGTAFPVDDLVEEAERYRKDAYPAYVARLREVAPETFEDGYTTCETETLISNDGKSWATFCFYCQAQLTDWKPKTIEPVALADQVAANMRAAHRHTCPPATLDYGAIMTTTGKNRAPDYFTDEEWAEFDDLSNSYARLCNYLEAIYHDGPEAVLDEDVERFTSPQARAQANAIYEVLFDAATLSRKHDLASRWDAAVAAGAHDPAVSRLN